VLAFATRLDDLYRGFGRIMSKRHQDRCKWKLHDALKDLEAGELVVDSDEDDDA
jgi:hypothetical protein